MKTNFFNENKELILEGQNVNKIFFYNEGKILGEIKDFTTYAVKGNECEEIHDGEPISIIFDFKIKRSTKLNLNRNDSFITKNPERKYDFEPKYNLYINSCLVDFEFIGDKMVNEINHQKNFFELYSVSFNKYRYKVHEIERIFCDDYRLKEGEIWSDRYGSDKEHCCVDTFEVKDNYFTRRTRPDEIGKKGIIKRWFEYLEVSGEKIVVKKQCYSKSIPDDYRKNLENLAKELKNDGLDYSYYDLKRLDEKGYVLMKKGV